MLFHLESPQDNHDQIQMRKGHSCLCYLMKMCPHLHFYQTLSFAESRADFAESVGGRGISVATINLIFH